MWIPVAMRIRGLTATVIRCMLMGLCQLQTIFGESRLNQFVSTQEPNDSIISERGRYNIEFQNYKLVAEYLETHQENRN